MQARINYAAALGPDVLKALNAVSYAAEKGGLPAKTADLVQLRASQINGCGVCVDMHWRIMRKRGETDERMLALSAWRDAPYFTDAERAALALTEAVTRIADKEDPVPDAIWNEAARHYDERALSTLLLSIGIINIWNRFNVATRQVAGEWIKSTEGQAVLDRYAQAAAQPAAAH
jgi:AhpD family alkylhydroperoxidase